MAQFPPLICSTIVYRALKNVWLAENGDIKPAAFIRRGPKPDGSHLGDLKGLSVNFDVVQARNYYRGKACSLHVGHVRDVNLDVEQDKVDHADITGVPPHGSDKKLTEDVATCLANLARDVSRAKR